MKVGSGTELPPAGGAGAGKSAPAARAGAPTASSAPSKAAEGVPVSVSSLARSLDGALGADPDVNLEQVAAVKNAIAKGTFTVDAEAIANRLLDSAVEALANQRGSSGQAQ